MKTATMPVPKTNTMMEESNMTYETWGNNEFHDPKLCENCEYDSCPVCSNGPREMEYRRAEAEYFLKYASREV